MTKQKSTKRALLLSALSLLMCVSMLIGSTFAWFTDSVTSGRNKIVAGNLDIVLEYKSNWDDEWKPVYENTKIFKEDALYEPGYTEVAFLRVSNAGNLALKYVLSFNIINEEGSTNVLGEKFRLSDYLNVGTYVQDENSSGFDYEAMFCTREAALKNVEQKVLFSVYEEPVICNNKPLLPGEDTSQVVAIVLNMPESVGNEANASVDVKAPWVEFGVNLFATQYTYESDSFDNQYDANATLTKVHVIEDLETLNKAFKEGGQGTIVNMHITDVNTELAANKSLALNMNTAKLEKAEDSEYAMVNRGDLSITGDGTIRSEMKGSIENWGKLYINNLNIDVKGITYGLHVKGGEAEINDLNLVAERGGLNVQGGKAIVNSGSYEFSGYYGDNKWYTGYTVYAGGRYSEVTVTINGGDFRYTGNNKDKGRILCADDNATIIVNGGTFGKGSSLVSSSWLLEADSNKDGVCGEIVIYGGTFEFDPSAFVAEGYEAIKGPNGWYTVSKIVG